MAKTQPSSAVAGLQDQIETIRREAFDAGYSAAMRAVSEFTAGPAKSKTTTAKVAPLRAAEPSAATRPGRSQAKPAARKAGRPTGVARRKTSRGDNARHVAEAMNGLPDRTGPAAAIRKALAGKGIDMSYTSVRHSLGQLQARGEASVADDGKTWTYAAPATS